MRIANSKSIDLIRKKGNKSPKAKYYIIPEGDSTEVKYFSGIKENSSNLNVNSLIDILIIENDEKEMGQSHPLKKLNNFIKAIKDGIIYFDKEIDKACFIFDRDPQNFKPNQYDDFINSCNKNKYDVYISNPTFELFLLFHSDDVLKLDRKEMLLNKKEKLNGKRFLEKKLSEFFGFNKKHIVSFYNTAPNK